GVPRQRPSADAEGGRDQRMAEEAAADLDERQDAGETALLVPDEQVVRLVAECCRDQAAPGGAVKKCGVGVGGDELIPLRIGGTKHERRAASLPDWSCGCRTRGRRGPTRRRATADPADRRSSTGSGSGGTSTSEARRQGAAGRGRSPTGGDRRWPAWPPPG